MKLSICIPMYNESKIIADTARTLSAYLSANFEDYEILFSNDGSTDDSARIVDSLGLPNVRVVGYEINQGKGAAIRTAMLEAKGDYVLFTDADLAYGTDVIARAVRTFEENPECDLVIGSRSISDDGYEGYTPLRRLASKIYVKVLCMVGGFRLSDSQCGCKAFSGRAAKEIFSRCKVNGFAFDFEALLWAEELDLLVVEMPVKIVNHGESKVRLLRDTAKMLRDLMRIRKNVKRAAAEERKKRGN